MFSWICPRCGRENRASDAECAKCHYKEGEEAAVSTAAEPEAHPAAHPVQIPLSTPAPERQVTDAPVQRPMPREEEPRAQTRTVGDAPARPVSRPVQAARQGQAGKPGIPTWILVPLFAFAFIGLGAALYFGYQRLGGGKGGFTGGEMPAAAAKPKAANPLQKYVEVVGIRLTQDARKRPQATFIAVNHSSSELDDVTANVTLWASTSRSEEDSVGTFSFKLKSIRANEAKEITTALKTKLKAYEYPDWQNVTADVQLAAQ